MTTHARLNVLLDEALSLPPHERDRWLNVLDARKESLEPRLRAVLAQVSQIDGRNFLGTLPKIIHADAVDAGSGVSTPPPVSAGPYRLSRKIASGGMGSVWLAERSDGLVKRPVALKLPRGMSHHAGLAERMVREREILSVLNHPNIARLYDAGVTADGQPYLALEYVEGKPIDEHCHTLQHGVRERLRLFLQMANAVAHAHAKLIVHRDLKPANVLVTPEGQVRLLDFGIAKLIEDGSAESSRLTEFSGRALTIDYASPEQIVGEPISTASDVYQLGVVLFELLTQTHPHRSPNISRRALEDTILNTEPAKPSERVTDRSLRRQLRGDLDTIVLRALKKRPDERYPTVNAFAEDIQRFLSGRPVCAQPDSLWYRFRRFVGRNRFASAAAGALMLVILVTAIMAIGIARSALADTKRLDVIKAMFSSIFLEVDPANPEGISLQTLEGILLDASKNTAVTVAADDYLRMRLEMRLALVQRRLGKVGQSSDRVQFVLSTLQRTDGARSEEYVSAKLLQAAFAMEDGRAHEAMAAEREASRLATTFVGNDRDLAAQARRLLAQARKMRGIDSDTGVRSP